MKRIDINLNPIVSYDSGINKYLYEAKRKFKKQIDEKTCSKKELIEHNLLFAVSIANHFANNGIPIEDLIQSANIGLTIAADKFDPNKGIKFISYAVNWIRKQILFDLSETGTMIRIPSCNFKYINQKFRELDRMSQKDNYIYTVEEASKINEQIDELFVYMFQSRNIDKLDDFLYKDDKHKKSKESILFSEEIDDFEKEDVKIIIKECLSILNKRARYIIEQFYFNGVTEIELAKELNKTRSCINFIKNQSLKKMKKYIKRLNNI